MLGRSITTEELVIIQSMFASNYGYKDLIREFKKAFGIDITKQQAKTFMSHRSWSEVLTFLTNDKIDTSDRDKIPAIEHKHYELLLKMLELNKQDELERQKDLKDFLNGNYYIPENVKYFNMPLYGEIITYKYKEPFLKCFLLDEVTHKINKIEDVPVSNELPEFLLKIIKKINTSRILTKLDFSNMIQQSNYMNYVLMDDAKALGLVNILDSPLFQKYNIVVKTGN